MNSGYIFLWLAWENLAAALNAHISAASLSCCIFLICVTMVLWSKSCIVVTHWHSAFPRLMNEHLHSLIQRARAWGVDKKCTHRHTHIMCINARCGDNMHRNARIDMHTPAAAHQFHSTAALTYRLYITCHTPSLSVKAATHTHTHIHTQWLTH